MRFKKLLSSAALLAFLTSPAFAQTQPTVRQHGSITGGHCAEWYGNQAIEDSGAACGGGGSTSLSIGTTTITGGTNSYLLYNNNGVLGNEASIALSGDVSGTTSASQLLAIDGVSVSSPTGTGAIVLANSPAFTGPVGIGTAANATYPLSIYETSSAGPIIIGTIQDTSHNAISLNGSTASGYINFASGAGDDNLYINRPTGFKIFIREGWTTAEDAILPTTGAVIIGTSSTGAVTNSMLTLYGGANIGASYVTTSPPANGAIIQGNVGIGTSSSGSQLSVGSSAQLTVDSSGDLATSGSITPSQTVGIIGTTTSNNANSGSFGEYVSSTVAQGSAVSATTNTPLNITSISLTAGDWDVSGFACSHPAGTTTQGYFVGGISPTSASLSTPYAFQDSTPAGATTINAAGFDICHALPVTRESIASTTSFYLVVEDNFGVSTLGVYGQLRARRVR